MSRNNQALVEQILKVVQEVKFGFVQITIHGGKIVQIEKTEKFRIPNDSKNIVRIHGGVLEESQILNADQTTGDKGVLKTLQTDQATGGAQEEGRKECVFSRFLSGLSQAFCLSKGQQGR